MIAGPFSTEELKQKMQLGSVSSSCHVWGKAMSDWQKADWWKANLETLIERLNNNFDDRLWHYAIGGNSYGPMARKQLVAELSKVGGDANEALIWTKGMKSWAQIHEFHDLMDDIGVDRRVFARANTEGKVVAHISDSQSVIGNLKTISEGGFGAVQISGLGVGAQFSIEIESPDLQKINATAQVRYISEDGFVGFKFVSINREAVSQIVSFVKEQVANQTGAA